MSKSTKSISADEIAERALAGDSILPYFESKAKLVRVPRRVNVDFAPAMLDELDNAAAAINVPRQSLIKMLLRYALGHLPEITTTTKPT